MIDSGTRHRKRVVAENRGVGALHQRAGGCPGAAGPRGAHSALLWDPLMEQSQRYERGTLCECALCLADPDC